MAGVKVIIGLCVVLAAGSAWADDRPFAGRWHWNRPQSTTPPGEHAPADLISEISRSDSHVKWSVTILTIDGRHVATFEAGTNGESHPISKDTTVSCRVVADALQTTFQGPAGHSYGQTCTLSADRKQMTCSGTLTDSDGDMVSYVDVYDKM